MAISKAPNFFIVGAARSGTTSLWEYLKVHPQVYMTQDELHKEPAYFSDKRSALELNNYLELFKDAQDQHIKIGDASTAYLTDPTSAKRIYNFDRNAKIIIILRNPVERAYSLYRWMVQDGYEFAESFEEALELEKERTHKKIPNWLEPEYYWNYMYFKSGLYSGQIQRYIDLFRDNVLIIDFVDFKDNPCSEYKNICNFLEIEPIEPPNETHNLSKKVLSSSLQFVLRKVTYDFIAETIQGEKPKNFSKSYMCSFLKNSWKFYKFSRRMPHLTHAWTAFSRFREEISKTNYRYDPAEKKEQRDFLLKLGIEPGKPPRVRVETKKNLLNLYRDDIQKLEKSLNRSFDHWS